MMSGTSMDGIDLSLIKTDGTKVIRFKKNFYYKYSRETIDFLHFALSLKNKIVYKPRLLKRLNDLITFEHIEAIKHFNLDDNVDLIGFHGQTIFHDPQKKITIQLGDGKLLSKIIKKNVIFDFRKNDIDNDGQGAPIAPIYHKQIIEELRSDLPTCLINIGGIANISYWDGIHLMGFDTGPGNCMLDSYVRDKFDLELDFEGNRSSKGKPDWEALQILLNDEYFFIKPPKSLDRQYFEKYFHNIIYNLNESNALCTLVYFTVFSIISSFKYLPKKPKNIIISGGGVKNNHMMKVLKRFSESEIIELSNYDFNTDFIESELIAFIAARCFYKKPITFPSTTGVSKPCTGGKLIKVV